MLAARSGARAARLTAAICDPEPVCAARARPPEHARLTGVDFLERPSSISRRILATATAIRPQRARDEVLTGFGAELPACPLGRDGARAHHACAAPIILPAARRVASGRQWLLRGARPARYYAPDPAHCATAASPARDRPCRPGARPARSVCRERCNWRSSSG